ncbi:MAG: hypothetical protein AAF399_13625 [Bacteroidota bacterium]
MSRQIHIANPLYDVVFRYLMEDNKVACLFLSAILGKEVQELAFQPTEYSTKIGGEMGLTVIRMDFQALIEEADGEHRLVLIELQKAKLYQQVMRFRSYLGKQYQNSQHIDSAGNPLPIYPVYILGESITKAFIPVIRVSREYTDAATQRPIPERHPFIEALSHDATVIQTKHLSGHRRTVLERFLSIFDQSAQSDPKGHILSLDEADYPEQYHLVIRRLQKALAEPTLEADMDIEDEVLTEFQKKDALIAKAVEKAEAAEKQAASAEQSLLAMIRRLHQSGFSEPAIANLTDMTEEELRPLLPSP